MLKLFGEPRSERRAPFVHADARLISTDVFDTLLLRTLRSERSRLALGETMFSRRLAERGHRVPPRLLLALRREAQRLAFRARNARAPGGEVRLRDVVARQLAVLGLPDDCLAERLGIEIEVEKRSLLANRRLADALRRERAGRRIVAVSDTMLSGEQVSRLLDHFHGPGLVDHVYSSADLGLTKRNGDIFAEVARREGVDSADICHFGDDPLADLEAARAGGLRAVLLERPKHERPLRRANGALAQASHDLGALRERGPARTAVRSGRAAESHAAFGRAVFGPILAELSIRIWLYASQAEASGRPVLLFCARGGIGMREAFERTSRALALPLATRCRNLPVSRLVAARAAVLARGPAAKQEIAREFAGVSAASVAKALGGRAYDLPAEWHRPGSADGFLDLAFSPAGAEALADIAQQTALFAAALDEAAEGADRLILCDTGLYGSTQRLLAEGFPDRRFETIQFARSNYKGHSETHFPLVTGLLVERRAYTPLEPISAVLRYWHVVESLFEPAIPSVSRFARSDEGTVLANCGPLEPGEWPAGTFGDLLMGAFSYLEDLRVGDGTKALADARTAQVVLREAIARPGAAEVDLLGLVADRSVDFGRAENVRVLSERDGAGLTARLRGVRTQLWREGAITRDFPLLKHLLLPAVNLAHVLRGLRTTGRN